MQDSPVPWTPTTISRASIQIFVGVNLRSTQIVDGPGVWSLVLVGNESRNRTVTGHRSSVTLHSCAAMSFYLRYVNAQIRTCACLFPVHNDAY